MSLVAIAIVLECAFHMGAQRLSTRLRCAPAAVPLLSDESFSFSSFAVTILTMSSPSRPVKTVSLTRAFIEQVAGDAKTTHQLDLKGRQIASIDATAFADQAHLTQMDLSDNKLTAIGPEFRPLKKLSKLDLRENLLSKPLTYMKYVPALEEIRLENNPLTLADKLVVLYYCPQLKMLDGKSVAKQREVVQKLVAQIKSKLDFVWVNDKCDDQLIKAAKNDHLVKACLRRIKKEVAVPELWTSAGELVIEDLVRQKISAESERLRQGNQRKQGIHSDKKNGPTPKRSLVPSSPVGPSPNKRLAGGLVYEPKVFLRCHCHNNNPLDSSTQVWKAAFKKERSGTGEHLVATCGGNLLCIIDCEQEKVVARYADPEPTENFYALAWTSLVDEKGLEEDVLAVGGNCCKIVVIRYAGLKCISKTYAHDKDINALLFHPSRKSWLFSGSYDKKIKLWNVQIDDSINRRLELLTEVEINNRVLIMTFSAEYKTLFVGGEEGLTVWQDVSEDPSQGSYGQVKFGRSSNAIIDGLSVFPDKPALLALKQSRTGRIHVSKIADLLSDLKKATVRSRLNSYRETQFRNVTDLEYTTTACDYFGLHVQPGLIACGDDAARICLYNTANISGDEQELQHIDDVLKWPEISNPKHGNKKVVDLTKPIVINSLTVSSDLRYIVAVTNINLVCVWSRSS